MAFFEQYFRHFLNHFPAVVSIFNPYIIRFEGFLLPSGLNKNGRPFLIAIQKTENQSKAIIFFIYNTKNTAVI